MTTEGCTHGEQVQLVRAQTDGCTECLASGDRWVHLRLCMQCGHVGCCDNSKNQHASRHFRATSHPIIASFEPGEDWGWCFFDEMWLDADWPMDGPRQHSEAANLHRE